MGIYSTLSDRNKNMFQTHLQRDLLCDQDEKVNLATWQSVIALFLSSDETPVLCGLCIDAASEAHKAASQLSVRFL